MEATVACVLRSGGVFTPEWVMRLRAQCHRHLPAHRFVCLTDMDVPDRIPLETHWPGWWSKLELFRPDIYLTERVLYFDLDTVLVSDASALFGYLGPFASLSDFYRPEIPASGVLAWDAALNATIWANIKRNPPPLQRRSDFYWPSVTPTPDRLQELYPGLIGSYKADKLYSGPKDFSVICFHGEPKQPNAAEWVQEVWR